MSVLSHINYYRFSGYGLAFEIERHTFASGTSFDSIVAAYEFDRQLRRLIVEAVEWIENDLRTVIAYEFGRAHGEFGHVDGVSFFRNFRHSDWLDRVREHAERSNEVFVEHFRAHYSEFPDLPIWVLVEIVSLGDMSRFFSGLLRTDQRTIARRYGRQPAELISWFHHLTYIRNLCAHYGRLWDRVLAIAPNVPHGHRWNEYWVPDNSRVFMTLLVIASLARKVNALREQTRQWKQSIEMLIDNNITVLPDAYTRMGFPRE